MYYYKKKFSLIKPLEHFKIFTFYIIEKKIFDIKNWRNLRYKSDKFREILKMWFHIRRIGGILANVNGIGSFHEFQRFRWKYGLLERGREFPRVPRVSKKISLKVWPTWTGSGVSTSSTSFKEDFVESMANLNGVGSFHEFHEFQRRFRWKYGRERSSTTFWEQRTAT